MSAEAPPTWFARPSPKRASALNSPPPDRSWIQFAHVVFHLATQYPHAQTIHLVMDHLNTHCRKSLTDLYGAEAGGEIWDTFTIHHAHKHGSWLNQAEIEIGTLSRQCPSR